MNEGIIEIGKELIRFYDNFIGFFPPFIGSFVNFLILVMLVVIYSIIVWHGYRFISRKNPLGLDLNQYNKASSPFYEKLITGGLYFIEHIIIIPFVILVVFGVFTLFLIILSPNENTIQILIISSTIIAAIRMIAYYKEGLSQEIAKILPLMLLATIVLNPIALSEAKYFQRIITHFNQIPGIINQIEIYLLFIIILEVILRLFDLIFSIFGIEEIQIKKEEED